MNKLILKPYQKDAFKWLLPRDIGALYLQMRLGKTILTIRKVEIIKQCQYILVVAPYSALRGWKNSLTNENQSFNLITGSMKDEDKKTAMAFGSKWTVVNKELYRSFDISQFSWDCVILDESTFIANPKTDVTKYFLRPIWQNVQYKYLLSGTPAPENDLQYYCQFRFLDYGIFDEKNYWDFRFKWFIPSQSGYDFNISPDGSNYIASKLSQYAYFLSRKDAGVGGSKVYEQRYCDMSDEIRKLYDQVVNTFSMEDKKTIFGTQKFLWLRQLASGFVGDQFRDRFKTLLLQELLDGELKHEQVAIWASYTNEIDTLWAHYDKECCVIDGRVPFEDREPIIKEFIKGKHRLLIGQPETMKWGEDLSCCDTMIFFSSPLGSLTRQQIEDRNIHLEKFDHTLILDLITIDSIDEDIYESHIRKESRAQMLQRIISRWVPF
jgi:SNF2 family DNA or RNA helicase